MKILITGGVFSNTPNPDNTYGRPSGLINKFADAIQGHQIVLHNGGHYEKLKQFLEQTPDYDIVFWFADVSNDLPKIRDVKAVAPYTMLVTSKRNDNQKYSFQELVQRALASKSNLMFEFSKMENGTFHIRIFDPLACMWYSGTDIREAAHAALHRLTYLTQITRQKTIQAPDDKSLVLNWYFDRFKQDMYPSDQKIETPPEQEFVDLVKEYAIIFHQLMNPGPNVKRFLGNCSLKATPPQVGRCSKGMPSFRTRDYIFVSQRNVDKEYLDLSNFVPTYMEDGKIYYCGDKKPSVDTPIQLRLYQALPNINYMIHAHCYVESGFFTDKSIPCGAIEEVDEILSLIDRIFNNRNRPAYAINLFGHGSIIMGKTLDDIRNHKFYKRPMPEDMTTERTF